jgi:hypothetical protein
MLGIKIRRIQKGGLVIAVYSWLREGIFVAQEFTNVRLRGIEIIEQTAKTTSMIQQKNEINKPGEKRQCQWALACGSPVSWQQ